MQAFHVVCVCCVVFVCEYVHVCQWAMYMCLRAAKPACLPYPSYCVMRACDIQVQVVAFADLWVCFLLGDAINPQNNETYSMVSFYIFRFCLSLLVVFLHFSLISAFTCSKYACAWNLLLKTFQIPEILLQRFCCCFYLLLLFFIGCFCCCCFCWIFSESMHVLVCEFFFLFSVLHVHFCHNLFNVCIFECLNHN